MTGVKISNLPAAGAITGSELVPAVQSSNTVRTTVNAVATFALTGNAASATTATNLAGGAAGSVPYQTGAGATALLAAGTSSQVLVSGATPAFTNTPALTGTNFTGIPNSAMATISTSTTDQTAGDIFRNGDWGIGTTATDIPDFTVAAANFSRIGRALAGATGGSGAEMGIVSMPFDGTPSTVYLGVTPGAVGAQRLWAGNKGSASASPTWTEFARVTTPTFTSNIGLGSISTIYNLNITSPITGGTTAAAINNSSTIQTGVTSNALYYRSVAQTAASASSYTVANLIHYQATQGTFGTNSVVTVQSGFVADNSLTGATSNYGFRGSIAAATGRWNLHMDGTAQNYILGNVGIGTGKTVPAFPLDVAGQIRGTYVGGVPANTLSAAGTTLATATVLAAQINVVTTVPAGQGVALPNVLGVPIWVFNNQATNALLVYPSTVSQTINALTAGAGFSLAATGKIQLVQVATNVWYTLT